MFCEKCGSKLEIGQKFCDKCGAQALSASGATHTIPSSRDNAFSNQQSSSHPPAYQYETPQASGRVGFSKKVNDPAFQKLPGKRNKSTLIAALIGSLIALVGSHIAGIFKEDLAFPKSFILGGLLSAFFLLFAFSQSLKSKRDSTWDGTVSDKLSKRKRMRDDDDNNRSRYTTVYELVVRRDSDGKFFKHEFNTPAGVYNYYEIGNRVRHHKGFYLYEKYDKTYDNEVLCVSCSKLQDINNDVCKTCKCPLLK